MIAFAPRLFCLLALFACLLPARAREIAARPRQALQAGAFWSLRRYASRQAARAEPTERGFARENLFPNVASITRHSTL